MAIQRHPASLDEPCLLAECDIRRGRRSGPGGQHRNKVETAIVITHVASGTRAEATERRSQEKNRQAAVFRLRVNLALRVRRPCDLQSPPSECWTDRVRSRRLFVSGQHRDFPALLAEALDALDACEMDLAATAKYLGVSVSQLVKFLKLEPRALQKLNDYRKSAGMRALR